MAEMCLFTVILENNSSQQLAVKVLMLVTHNAEEERRMAIQTALGTPSPADSPAKIRDCKTLSKLGYNKVVMCYKTEDVRIPQVVAFFY